MKKLNIPLIPVITGTLALIAVAAVLIIVIGAGGDAGLYVTEASGSVSISNSDSSGSATAAGDTLRQGDIVTVGEGASCKLMYKSKKNSDDNYIIVSSGSQIVITDDLNGKKNGEIYLNRGSVLCNLAGNDSSKLYIRTADSMVYPEGTVTKISYATDGFEAYTDVYTFMGNSRIQLYDAQGNAVNDPEYLVEKRTGRVTTNDLGPVFSYLNIEFPLSGLSAAELKNLVSISTLIENFPYDTKELKAAYDASPDKGSAAQVSEDNSADTSEPIQTAGPLNTEPPAVTDPPHEATTGPAITHQTQAQATTAAPPVSSDAPAVSESTSSDGSDTHAGEMCTVIIIVEGDEDIQEVPYGGSAEKPEDPAVEGKTFIGWDRSFDNITEDTVITALFTGGGSSEVYHTVTIKIADKTTTVLVEDGGTAPLPSVINIEGYVFKGWDADYSNVRSDITVTAILEPQGTVVHRVTFMIDGVPYVQEVEHGKPAVPPFTPISDAAGNPFTGWDQSITSVVSDMTVTALYSVPEHTVTFVVEGISYPVKVKHGSAAVPPITPTVDSTGTKIFFTWDADYSNVTYDMIINAIFI